MRALTWQWPRRIRGTLILPGLILWTLSFQALADAAIAGDIRHTVGVGSAHLREVVQDLGFPADQVVILVPPAQCPGHFDASPAEISALASCHILLVHPWQRQLANLKRAMDAAGVRNTITVDIPGNWMVPDTLADGIERVAAILGEHFGDTGTLRERARQRAETVRRVGTWFRERVRKYGLEDTPVLCQTMQEPCARWAGLRVVATFDRAEAMGADQPFRLLQAARAGGVRIVVDNLQSGDDRVGARLADDLSVPRVVWSNFPGAFAGMERWEETVAENLRRLAAASGLADADFTGWRELNP